MIIALLALNLVAWCRYFEPSQESDGENSWQFARMLGMLESYIRRAASLGADVFIAPEMMFALNLHYREAMGRVDQRKKYSYGKSEYDQLKMCLWSLSRSYPRMLIVGGTILWTDEGNFCRNTCLYANAGRVYQHDKSDLEGETGMMSAGPGSAKGYRAVRGTSTSCCIDPEGQDRRYCIQICRDSAHGLSGEAAQADVILIPAWALGPGTMPRNKIVIVCDGGSNSYISVNGRQQAYPLGEGFVTFNTAPRRDASGLIVPGRYEMMSRPQPPGRGGRRLTPKQ